MAYKILDWCIGCTACSKRCPTEAISGERNKLHVIDPELCIDCGACGVVCPVECIADDQGDICKGFPRREWPKATVIEDNCIGSGCELCINICPFEALYLDTSGERVGDFFGVATVIEKRCTGCRLCEDACGWGAIYIDPPREALKKKIYEPVEMAEARPSP
ncbi:Ferredoxin [bacterium HR25]|jgi:formate hydrogenlyase subunit 6/NADH:ubiquinone oxidoreductase subunit I|nr:Ferredoxin [bacterium HR25]